MIASNSEKKLCAIFRAYKLTYWVIFAMSFALVFNHRSQLWVEKSNPIFDVKILMEFYS
jgi:hypothetical protein